MSPSPKRATRSAACQMNSLNAADRAGRRAERADYEGGTGPASSRTRRSRAACCPPETMDAAQDDLVEPVEGAGPARRGPG